MTRLWRAIRQEVAAVSTEEFLARDTDRSDEVVRQIEFVTPCIIETFLLSTQGSCMGCPSHSRTRSASKRMSANIVHSERSENHQVIGSKRHRHRPGIQFAFQEASPFRQNGNAIVPRGRSRHARTFFNKGRTPGEAISHGMRESL